MPYFRSEKSNRQAKRNAAVALGLETGMFGECPVCREIIERQSPQQLLDQTMRLAEQLIRDRDERVAVFDGNSDELISLLRRLKTDLPYECVCERI